MKPLKCLIRMISECFEPASIPRPNEANLAFMVCVIRVKVRSHGWQKAVNRVLRSTNGVRQFKLVEDGKVIVSGMVDPSLLMKNLAKSGKSAELEWIQYGQCSSNLFLPPQPPKAQNNGPFSQGGPFRNFRQSRFALPHLGGYHGLPLQPPYYGPPPPPPPPLPPFYEMNAM
ncbi:hypothetical protein HAX54_003749 [Datura stramonium]|uniref:HMA domain-containing protein n=1 Tax=Datura stramonium TaxID=4076 RepID=A0ABS8T6Z9_DATST|nr:hypothetical protein [Datura stramonium]